MSAPNDRKTYPSPAGGRWRQSDRDYFHRGFGQARHLLPKRHHRASGKLHQRWVFRIISAPTLVSCRLEWRHLCNVSEIVRDSSTSLGMTKTAPEPPLQFPDRFSAD